MNNIYQIASVRLSHAIGRLWRSLLDHLLDGSLCKNFCLFSLFQAFNYDFIIYTYLTHISAPRTVIDDVTNEVVYRIFNINL